MALDANFVQGLAAELRAALLGGRVEKLHQPGKEELLLHIRARQGAFWLLLCCATGRARAGLITERQQNPAQPTMLCMRLRKHFSGAVLRGIEQPPGERILQFEFSASNEIGDATAPRIILECTGRHPNLLFTHQNGIILDAMRRFDLTQSARPVLPGLPYAPPPSQGYVPASIPGDPQPMLQRAPNGVPLRFAAAADATDGWEPCASFSQALELYYNERDAAERRRQRVGALLKLCETRMARARRKVLLQQEELKRAEQRESLRIAAELLLAFRAQIEQETPRGATQITVPNYYNENRPLPIALQPELSLAANAQRYFKEHQKQKNAAARLTDLIAASQEEALYLESCIDFLQRATTQTEVEALREELARQGYLKPPKPTAKRNPKQKPPPGLPPITYQTPNGMQVLVGRNNLQNDQLSFKTARGSDYWLHVQNQPGSHVILVCAGQDPTPASLEFAAAMAVRHSKATGGSAVVDFTQAKHLKKPKGAPPGKVIYHTHNSMLAHDRPP